MVPAMGAEPELVAAKMRLLPAPLAPRPMFVLLLVHV